MALQMRSEGGGTALPTRLFSGGFEHPSDRIVTKGSCRESLPKGHDATVRSNAKRKRDERMITIAEGKAG